CALCWADLATLHEAFTAGANDATASAPQVQPHRVALNVGVLAVCLCLSLILKVGLGYYAWQRLQAESHQWQARYASLTDQLAAQQAHAQREAQDSAALRQQLAVAQERVRQTQAKNHEWQARYAGLTRQLATLQEPGLRTLPE